MMIYVQAFFDWLLDATVIGSVVICLILAAQKALGGKLGPRWCHALWLVLLVRMVLPWAPSSRVSLFNLIPSWDRQAQPRQRSEIIEQHEPSEAAQTSGTTETMTAQKPQSGVTVQEQATAKPTTPADTQSQSRQRLASLRPVLPVLWLGGVMVIGAYLLMSDFALWRIVKRDRPLLNQAMLELFEECKAQMGVQSLVTVVPSSQIRSPGLFGFIRPRLLLPLEMLEKASRQELRYVFLHELAHLRRHDIYLGWLTSLLQVLHWFNPLIWFAFYRMRTDRELACDALVLARTGEGESKQYGQTIVGLLRRFSRSRPLPAMAGILETKSQLKRRMTMIARSERPAYKMTPLAVTLIIVVGCVSVPGPKYDSRSRVSALEQHSGMTLRKLKEQWGGFANISSDGRYLCDADDWEDDGNLMICDLVTGKRWPVTENGPGEAISHYAEDAAISPDSGKVAYLWHEEKTGTSSLWLVGSDGTDRRRLCEGKYIMPKDWSADGSKILAVIYGQPHQMVWISASDGSIQHIKNVGKEYPGKFDVSPDGRFIAYDLPQANDTPKRDVFLYNIAEDREIRLIETPADDVLLGWTPDGKSIFFSSDRTGTWDGWLLDVRDGKPARIPQRVKPGMGKVEPVGFRSNGDYYFGVYDIRRSVYTASFDPATCLISFPLSPVRQTGSQDDPDWSPDGKYLAYYDVEKENGTPVICIRSVATGQEREIEPKLPLVADLRWAPDGRSFLVTGSADRNRPHLMVYQMDVQTGERTELVRSENTKLWAVQWLPDGKRLLYCRRPSIDDAAAPRTISLVIRNIDTGHDKDLVRVELPDLIRSWALSPDGRRLAVDSRSGGVNLVSVDGGQTRELLDQDWAQKSRIVASWSPDGGYIFLLIFPELSPKPPITELWRIAAAGGQPEKLQTFRQLSLVGMRVHPSGKQVTLCAHEGLYEMWVMENFLPEELGK
jgi:beta-lactamase regulating signal transducer with metallopeptidase domain/Tol biopolymer transport system component